jgi:catechol 2,3-dioxygenase-like lactoylglutathione lyase family enzyme
MARGKSTQTHNPEPRLTPVVRAMRLARVSLHHVSLEVSADRLDECVSFWKLLGFEPFELPAEYAGQVAWVHRKGTSIHLIVTDDPVVPKTGHAAVVVEPYDATLDRLRGSGFQADPQTEFWGAPRAYLRDPAGHRVEVMAAPPPI